MAEKIGVWSVHEESGRSTAQPLEELRTTETEQHLEELLVASPDVLMPELTLVGRQLPTTGGPLDLLGVDQQGRLVLFELKRGTLTREAVAQVLDYGSELRERKPEDIARLIQSNSGRHGIDVIEDFADWYRSEFPDVEDPPPSGLRLVLVGLGVDDRARRMVNFLAGSGIDIQLLTFQAFKNGPHVLLARHVETLDPREPQTSPAGGTKEGNRRLLEQLAESRGVGSLFFEVADFVESRLPGYRWPGKTAFTFSLQELTEQGSPSLRAYASLAVDQSHTGRVVLSLTPRAAEVATQAIDVFLNSQTSARKVANQWTQVELLVTPQSWPGLKAPIGELLDAVTEGWRRKLVQQKRSEVEVAPTGSP